jgi:hypothetical protein
MEERMAGSLYLVWAAGGESQLPDAQWRSTQWRRGNPAGDIDHARSQWPACRGWESTQPSRGAEAPPLVRAANVRPPSSDTNAPLSAEPEFRDSVARQLPVVIICHAGVHAVVEPCQHLRIGSESTTNCNGSTAMSGQRSVRVDARAPKGRQHQGGQQGAEVRLQCGSGQSEWRPHCSKATRASARVAVINSGIGTDSLGPCARPASPGP